MNWRKPSVWLRLGCTAVLLCFFIDGALRRNLPGLVEDLICLGIFIVFWGNALAHLGAVVVCHLFVAEGGSKAKVSLREVHQLVALRPSEDPLIKELIAQNRFGSAVEKIERGLEKFSDDFEGWMLLARLQIEVCHAANEAKRVLLQVRRSPAFTPEQKDDAENRMREWRRQK